MRAAVPHGHAESLCTADDDIRAHLSRRNDERECEQVGRHGHEHVALMGTRGEPLQIEQGAVIVWRLHEGAEHIVAEIGRSDRRRRS